MVLSDHPFGAGTGEIVMDDVNCEGSEISLRDCPHLGPGQHNCEHHEDVSVKCLLDITGQLADY